MVGAGLFSYMQLEKMILAGLVRKIKDNFSLTTEPVLISTNDRWKLADRINKQTANSSPLQLPMAFLRLTSLEINHESYNPDVLRRLGMYTPAATGSDVVRKYHMLPAVFSFELVHLSEDFFDMLKFSKNYILATRDRSNLNFKLDFDGIDIDIRVMVDEQISVPEKDNQIDIPNVYELTSNVMVKGYCCIDLEEAKEIEIIQRVASTVQVGTIT